MQYVWATVLLIANLCWLGLNLLGLPGNWLILLSTALLAWWYWAEGLVSVWTLAALLVLAILGEVAESLAGAAGSRRAGASRGGAWGAFFGGILGAVVGTFAIPIPLVGSLLGACMGAAGGAWAMELAGGRTRGESMRSAMGAGAGRLLGTVSKIAIGGGMWLLATVATFWP